MKRNIRWIFLLLVIAALPLAACAKQAATSAKSQPVSLEPIKGTDIKRVKLVEQAAKRIDIQTAAVGNGQVSRKQVIGGEVVADPTKTEGSTQPAAGSASGDAWVRIILYKSDLRKVNWQHSAVILSMVKGSGSAGLAANWIDVQAPAPAGADGAAQAASGEGEEESQIAYYVVQNGGQTLAIGQLVGVELPMQTNGNQRIVVPYAAVVYNQNGETWVYTNPESLVFVRRPIIVDYIEGDQAFLTVGPPSGTKVVTVGVAELFGAETGVSK